MSKVFFSFLGTNNYLNCNYEYDGKRIENVRFIQTAVHRLFGHDVDRIVIAVTEQAKINNAAALKEELNADIEFISIPDGSSVDKLWDIFNILSESFTENDEVIFDVTHSFRSLPVITTMLFQYLGVVKRVKLSQVLYGAFETLGAIRDVEKISIAERNAPVFDLTPFVAVSDWAMAIRDFSMFGSSTAIGNLTNDFVKPILKTTKGEDESAQALNKLSKQLTNLTSKLSTCRGGALCKSSKKDGTPFSTINETVGMLNHNLIPPMSPVIQQLSNMLDKFDDDSPWNAILAAEWCADHQMIQQGYTFLQEGVVSVLEPLFELKKFAGDFLKRREFISSFLCYGLESQAVWKGHLKNNAELAQIILSKSILPEELFKTYKNLSEIRNDINHCGFLPQHMCSDKLILKLKTYCKKIRNCLNINTTG